MKIQIKKTWLIGGVLILAAITLRVVLRDSIYAVPAGSQHVQSDFSVPAGAQHAQSNVATPPDNISNLPPATNNFTSAEYMNRGYCYAGSSMKDTKAFGGFGPCDNFPRKVKDYTLGNGLFLLAEPSVAIDFYGNPGMRVSLVNQTKDILAFSASDSRVNIIQEAQDADGTWKPIEHLPSSWCGNSYHRVFLTTNHYWEFAAPRYKGSINTKLRFSMSLADGSQMHSNIFDGSVNPNQFTIKPVQTATNIMDPYDE